MQYNNVIYIHEQQMERMQNFITIDLHKTKKITKFIIYEVLFLPFSLSVLR